MSIWTNFMPFSSDYFYVYLRLTQTEAFNSYNLLFNHTQIFSKRDRLNFVWISNWFENCHNFSWFFVSMTMTFHLTIASPPNLNRHKKKMKILMNFPNFEHISKWKLFSPDCSFQNELYSKWLKTKKDLSQSYKCAGLFFLEGKSFLHFICINGEMI